MDQFEVGDVITCIHAQPESGLVRGGAYVVRAFYTLVSDIRVVNVSPIGATKLICGAFASRFVKEGKMQ